MKKPIPSGLLIILFLLPLWLQAQIPTGYYDAAAGKSGTDLKAALHNIIKGHTEHSYAELWGILSDSDEDPNNSNNVILIYSGISRAKNKHGGSNGDWNREHVWAKSHGDFGTNPPAGTDAHHIRPADVQVNSLRGHLDFDEGGSSVSGAPQCKKDNDSFEPRDAVKGDVARMIFYMATRYEGDHGEPDLEVVDRVNTYPEAEMGKLSVLLKWNVQDPPDDFERHRNDVIFNQYQHNRNPFIDHPEYVTSIWGGPTSIHKNPDLSLEIFPNPVTRLLHVVNGTPETLNYSIYQFNGKCIAKGTLRGGETVIDLQKQTQGPLLLTLSTKNGRRIKTYKLIKTKNKQ